jgi:hypothetical protein
MVCCGVIPIDNLRDVKAPMELVAKRIPQEMFEKVYKIQLPTKYTASELLQVYSAYKGYVTGNGLPDENKAARTMLKDYNSGKLLFVHLRPDYDKEKHGEVSQTNVEYTLKEADEESKEESKVEEMSETSLDTQSLQSVDLQGSKIGDPTKFTNHREDNFDEQFFTDKKEQKMNKAQKRALKFAKKRGENPDGVDLNNPAYMKGKGNRMVGGYIEKKNKTGGNSNKITHFSKMVLE